MTEYADRPWPTRGLVFTRNHKGRPWDAAALERWLRLNRRVFKTRKCEMLAPQKDSPALLALLEAAPALDLRISWRCQGLPPAGLSPLAEAGLLDLCAVMRGTSTEPLTAWGNVCRAAALPLRVMLAPPFDPHISHEAWAAACKQAQVRQLTIAAADPFITIPPHRKLRAMQQALSYMNGLAETLASLHEDADLYIEGLPFCQVTEANRARCINGPQHRRDPAHFDAKSYALAQRLWRIRPAWGDKAVQMVLGLHSAWPNPIDAKLLPWVLDHPWLCARLWALHKLTRHIRLPFSAKPSADHTTAQAPAKAPARFVQHEACRACRFRLVCDRLPASTAPLYPGMEAEAIPGETLADPTAQLAPPRYSDAVDGALARQDRPPAHVVERARRLLDAAPPTRTIGPYAYEVEGQWSKHSAGNVRWFSVTASEKRSAPLATLTPPAMIAVNLGDGIADLAGFSLGKHAKIAAPMTAFSHRFALYVAEDGSYVLLRDGHPVRPVEFAGDAYVPLRIGSCFAPQIALWNIDGSLTTQSVSIWEEGPEMEAGEGGEPRLVSFVVVCTRFARRLEAALHHLARQPQTPRGAYEVIIAYVPGMDATLDVVESLQRVYPDLRVVTLPFTPDLATAKGIMINECVRLAKGRWVALLDADALIPPGLLHRLAQLPDAVKFAVPDGRKMLGPETTAGILLRQRDAWAEWDALLHEAEEYRYDEADGVPIGFLQIARRSCFDSVQYLESCNFEGADYKFGMDMIERFGPPHRMSGMPVLHLDHGGSQWYGTSQHR